MLSTQDLGVEIPIILSGDGAGIGLSAILTRQLLLRLMCFTESALRVIKYRARKAASMVLVVVTVVVARDGSLAEPGAEVYW